MGGTDGVAVVLLEGLLELFLLLVEFSGSLGVVETGFPDGLQFFGLLLGLPFVGEAEEVLPALPDVLSQHC